jgi:hypothetical protein
MNSPIALMKNIFFHTSDARKTDFHKAILISMGK